MWADVLVHLLLYMLLLPQGQCWVSVLIGFREERRGESADCRQRRNLPLDTWTDYETMGPTDM